MKRNLLALAIPALLVAGAANASIEVWNKDGNKLDFYGRVKAANNIAVGSNSKVTDKKGDDTSARFGFTGETQVTDSLTGYGRAEFEKKTGKDDSDGEGKLRYAYAGLNFGQAGAVDYGRNDGVLKAITAYTDVLPQFGGDASDEAYVLSQRNNAVLTYRNAALVDGLSFAVQYADRTSTIDATTGLVDKGLHAYGLNAQYEIMDTGLTVGGGYAFTEKVGNKKVNSYMAGIKYDANNLYLAAIYAHTKHDKQKTNGYEFVAQYGIDLDVGRITPSLAYIQHKDKKVPLATGGTGTDTWAKYVDVGMTYDFNKNLSALVDYKINLKRNDTKYKDVLGVGLIYQF